MGEVWPMCADIVDRGIEHGTAKFIVDGGRSVPVKYDDYNRDEIGSRDFFAALEKKEIYMRACVCVRVCIIHIFVYIHITVIENTRKNFKLQQ